jgi:hypothetical protein
VDELVRSLAIIFGAYRMVSRLFPADRSDPGFNAFGIAQFFATHNAMGGEHLGLGG